MSKRWRPPVVSNRLADRVKTLVRAVPSDTESAGAPAKLRGVRLAVSALRRLFKAEQPLLPLHFPSENPQQDPQLPWDSANALLERQLGTADALDSKIGNLFTWGGASLGVMLAVLALRPGNFRGISLVAFILAAVAYALLAVVTFRAVTGRPFSMGPDPQDIVHDLSEHPEVTDHDARWEAALSLIEAWHKNEPALQYKSNALRWAIPLLVGQNAALVLGLAALALHAS